MIWFFERPGERLSCEIRPTADGVGYELVWDQNGQTHTERFLTSDEVDARRCELETKLKLDGWKRLGRETPPHPDAKRFI